MDGISTYNNFLALHKPQLILSGVPEIFWPVLCKKIIEQIFDSGLAFQLVKIDYEDAEKSPFDPVWTVITIRDINCTNPTNIFLVDHAWTFKPNSIISSLRNVPGLLERMCSLMQVSGETTEKQIENVSQTVWKYANCYAIGGSDFSVEDRVPVWYVLDELGSGITHSENPNFRAVPFIHVPDQMTYTLLFPIDNIDEGEIVRRNFIEGTYADNVERDAMLIPWKYYEHFDKDFTQEEPGADYFLSGHMLETLPNLESLVDKQNSTDKLKVFSEYRFINEHLTAPEFQIVHNENDADILWYTKHFLHFEDLSINSPQKFVNQFPFEYIITVKDLLPIVARRCEGKEKPGDLEIRHPLWLPITYNMKTELSKLVAFYMQRKKSGLDNHWICKPYNLARGLDMYITDNLDFLCRLPLSGPKIAQKYIENPVLFERPDIGSVKFDVRYVIILKSVNPTKVYIYNNFFIRFANKPFDLNDLDDYEKHFTVMNYAEGVTLHRMLCEDFKTEWAKQYGDHTWDEVEKSIFRMFSELFTAATSKDPPLGIAKSPQSRALYAADIMLSWGKGSQTVMLPSLLELNWMPDCRRACEYYPDFYNDIFSVMFLDKEVDTCRKVL